MADELEVPQAGTTDRHEAWKGSMAAKYESEDTAEMDAEDGLADDSAGSTSASDTDDANDAGHTAAETSGAPDGAKPEPAADPVDDDDDEHTDDDEEGAAPDAAADDSANVDKDAEGGDAAEAGEDAETAISNDTKALLAAKGADLKLEDVPAEFRPIVEKKMRGMDQAFSRAMQELTTYRAEKAQFETEQRFQAEHPELLIAELFRKHPTLFDKVDALNAELVDDAAGTAFDKRVADTRKAAKDAVDAAHAAFVESHERATKVVETARRLAATAGLDYELVEPALIVAVQAKPKDQQHLTEEEIATEIAKVARLLKKPVRKQLREQSRERVIARTERRATSSVAARAAAPSAPATPAPPKAIKVDHNSATSRQAAMLASARRIMKGVPDGR